MKHRDPLGSMSRFAGLRHINRLRGTGWLDCPNCHEHAGQDVVDEMTFLVLFFLRLSPVGRHRILHCRRCGFRRPATAEEMERLDTAGAPVRHAWMFPFGAVFVAVLVALVVFLTGQAGKTAADTLVYLPQRGAPVAPVTYEAPSAWDYTNDPTCQCPGPKITVKANQNQILLRRFPLYSDAAALINDEYAEDTNPIQDSGYPTSPPATKTVDLAGTKALTFTTQFTKGGEKAELTMYAFIHDKVGYTLTYFGVQHVGDPVDEIALLHGVADRFKSTLKFVQDETPAPCTVPALGVATAGGSPVPSPPAVPGAPTAAPTATPEGTPAPSLGPCPTPFIPPSPSPSPSGSGSAAASTSASPSH